MSWTDLFKSKSAKLKPDPQIRWFGKLPSYSDYYSSKADESWAVEFNDWVLRGFEIYQARRTAADHRPARLPVAGGAVRLPESGMTVFASIQDYGGDMRGRAFPICFYVGVPTSQWIGPTYNRLAAAGRVIRSLMALRREVPRFLNSPGRFEAVFGDREVDLTGIDNETTSEAWRRQALSLSLADWFEGARGHLAVQEPATWFQLAAKLGETIAKLEGDDFEPTLRFPLAAGPAFEVQLSGWLRWLGSRMDLERRTLSLLLSGEAEVGGGHVSVIARELGPEDFLLTTTAARTLTYLDDLSAAKADEVEAADSSGREPVGSWADFVESNAAVS